MRRRQLLASLAVTAAAAVGAPILPTGRTPGEDAAAVETLVARVRDTMLGLHTAEAARQLAVLARKADWHEQALSIALTAADRPATKSLISGLLVSGRTTSELRGLAARVGVLA
ncbi:hypothetical protein [Streptomyces sp. XH2]|uniref:hypothetical protein n=1 Tax=Streptomyces sp. XH2 TaxID=3412483 RepID=UPI003C7E7136